MKWLKTIIGILLIIAAVVAIYYWNTLGNIEANEDINIIETIAEKSKEELVLEKGYSFFLVPEELTLIRSSLLKTGDKVMFINLASRETIGSYEIAALSDERVEIICSLQDYYLFDSLDPDSRLLLVLEAVNE